MQTVFQGGGFASTLWGEHDIHLRIGFQQLVSAVVAAVGDPHDAELVLGIIYGQCVRHLLCHHLLLVVGADQQCHCGQFVVTRYGGLQGFPLEEPLKPYDDV